MGWKSVVWKLVKALLPTVVVPALVAGLILYRFGLTTDSVVAILILTQLYVAWAEVEVVLRQTYIAMLEYEPEFKIEAEDKGLYLVKVGNVGKHVARNIIISVSIKLLQEHGKEVYKEEEVYKEIYWINVTSLAPGEYITLEPITREIFNNSEIRVKLYYETIYGEVHSIVFAKKPGSPVFIAISAHRKPGVLLNSLEELSSILQH